VIGLLVTGVTFAFSKSKAAKNSFFKNAQDKSQKTTTMSCEAKIP
jgi:hypothetical protein